MRNNNSKTGLLTIITMGLLGVACSGAADEPVDSSEPTDIEIAGESQDEATASDAVTIRGTLHDAVSGSVVTGATICAGNLGDCVVGEVDGSFVLEAAERDSELSVYLVADGYYPARFEVQVMNGVAWLNGVVLPLEAVEQQPMATSAAVLFRVVEVIGSNPTPVEGVEVHVGDYAASYANEGRFDDGYAATGPDGLALLQNVPLGTLDVSVEESFGAGCRALADGGMVSDTTLSIEAGTVTMVDVLCL